MDDRKRQIKTLSNEIQLVNSRLAILLKQLTTAVKEDKPAINTEIATVRRLLDSLSKKRNYLQMNKLGSKFFEWIPSGRKMNRQQARKFMHSL